MKIKIKKPSENAKVPVKASADAACVDLYSIREHVVPACTSQLISTGFCIEVPSGYEAQIGSRSGLALKQCVFVMNSPGTIDADYRGEVGVILYNAGSTEFVVHEGDRVAQMTIKKIENFEFDVVDELSTTERNAGGFGSTGVK